MGSYSIKVKKPVMEFWFLVRRRRGIRKAQWEKISESHWAHNDRAEHGGKEREMEKLFFGSNFVFFPLHYCGLYAFPRRICDYPLCYIFYTFITLYGLLFLCFSIFICCCLFFNFCIVDYIFCFCVLCFVCLFLFFCFFVFVFCCCLFYGLLLDFLHLIINYVCVFLFVLLFFCCIFYF